MRPMLNRHIPFDAISRWWYILVVGPGVGLVFSLVTDKPFAPVPLPVPNVEGSPRTHLVAAPDWIDDLLFAVIGFLLAIGVIWLLEEIRAYNQQNS